VSSALFTIGYTEEFGLKLDQLHASHLWAEILSQGVFAVLHNYDASNPT
jgi:hypothetical protein